MRNIIVLGALVATATVVLDASSGNAVILWIAVFAGFALIGTLIRRRRTATSDDVIT